MFTENFFEEEEFVKINDSLIIPSEYTDTIPHNSIATYYITGVYDYTGCESDSSEHITIDPFVYTQEKPGLSKQLLLSPNPANTNIRLTLPDLKCSDVKINIYDTWGKLIQCNKVPFERSVNIYVSDFEEGVYMLVVNESNTYYCTKFVVQH